jgi:hypothetical protein
MGRKSHTWAPLIYLEFMPWIDHTFSYSGRPNTSRIQPGKATHSPTVVALIHLEFMPCKGYTFSYSARPNTSRVYAKHRLHILL